MTIHNTTGSVTVKVDGITVLTLTNIDTQAGSNSYANQAQFKFNVVATTSCWLDDIYVCDNTGSDNNDFLSDCQIESIIPNGVGNNSDWTPSAGSNYQCIDEIPANDDTDYVESATSGHIDLYTHNDLARLNDDIKGTMQNSYIRTTDATVFSINHMIRSGGSNNIGASVAIPGTTYDHMYEIQDKNPISASAWTVSDINNSEFGIKIS